MIHPCQNDKMLWKRNVKFVKGCPSCHHVMYVCHQPQHETPEFIRCHGVTVRSRPPGGYDQSGIGGPDRLGFTWADWPFQWFCRWEDGRTFLSILCVSYEGRSREEPQRTCWASLKHWSLPLPVFDKSRMSKTCHTQQIWRMGEGDVYRVISAKMHWHLCLTMWNEKCV